MPFGVVGCGPQMLSPARPTGSASQLTRRAMQECCGRSTAPYRNDTGSTSTSTRALPVTGTWSSQCRSSGCTAMSRRVFSSSRRRCRPRRIASGAGAGPSTVTPVGARRGAAQVARQLVRSLRRVRADDQRRQAAVGRPVAGPPPLGLRSHEGVQVAADQRLHHRMLGAECLQQHLARRLRPPGAARDLVQQLHRPLRRAQVAAGQAKVGVDHAHQASDAGSASPWRRSACR